jgi:hypothetical protein
MTEFKSGVTTVRISAPGSSGGAVGVPRSMPM